jgi:hypothetical protein
MNVKTGIEAKHFPEKEYINGILVAVWVAAFVLDTSAYSLSSSSSFQESPGSSNSTSSGGNIVLISLALYLPEYNSVCGMAYTEYSQKGNGRFLAYIPS